jgi:hypothetical protein
MNSNARLKRNTTYNMGLAKGAVQWLIEHSCFVTSAVLENSPVFVLPPLRQYPKPLQSPKRPAQPTTIKQPTKTPTLSNLKNKKQSQ